MEIDIAKYIDFTLLKPEADSAMFKKLCEDAVKHKFYSVCIPPYMIKECAGLLEGSGVKICTVAGFPSGYADSETKAFEVGAAVKNGADEADAVINVSALKSKKTDYIKNELALLRKAAGTNVLKIIIETCYLTPEEIVEASKLVSESGADFVKTSTGFGPCGARLEDVELIKKSILPGTKIKASGGIKSYAQALEFINAGASRIGASSLLLRQEINK